MNATQPGAGPDGGAPGTAEAEVRALLGTLTRFLAAVAVLALIFTAVNVTLFAVRSGIPWPIAILLDPLVALTLTAVLYADARLAALGIRPPRWSTALRWAAGLTAALLNTWTSLWPGEQLGWPRHADIAGVVLHIVPPLMLIGLTETVAAYRRTLADLSRAPRTGTAPPPTSATTHGQPEPLSAQGPETAAIHIRHTEHSADHQHRTATGPSSPDRSVPVLGRGAHRGPTSTEDPPLTSAVDPHLAPSAAPSSRPEPQPRPAAATSGGHVGPHAADSAPTTAPVDPTPRPGDENPTDGDLFTRALTLDAASRELYGRGVSIRRLRTELHLGPKRARTLHDRIQQHRSDPPPR